MISDEFKKIASSVEIFDKCQLIGKKFGLHVDQVGELDAEIRDIFDGTKKSSDFIDDIIKRLEINQDQANKISTEVNREIFSTIKSKIQSQTGSDESTISSLERTGNFTIEKEIPSEPGYGNNTGSNGVTYADREKILAGLEDPVSAKGTVPTNLPTGGRDGGGVGGLGSASRSENYTEPLVDYLLSNPIAQGKKEVVVGTENKMAQQKPAPVQQQRQGPDPYREEVK